MRSEGAETIDVAIAWHLRLQEADDAAWGAFIEWLEASPAHAAAYDRVAADDRMIADARFPEAPVVAGNDNAPVAAPGRRWRWYAGGAISAAAALVVALAGPALLAPHASAYQVATAAGESRVVTLSDGTMIEMSGGTALKLDHANARVATLERGEAVFHVRHDAANPFTVTAGGVALRDLGTVFNVAHESGRVSVAVSEGAVLFQPGESAVALHPGDALTAREGGDAVVRSKIAPELVGGWRQGTLSFGGEPMREVAATLRRLYGTDIVLKGDLSDRPFTGMVHFSGSADRDVPHLAELTGATWRRNGGQWILSEQAPAGR